MQGRFMATRIQPEPVSAPFPDGSDSLTSLGMAASVRQAVGRAMSRPSGLVIVSGSGKDETIAALRTHWPVPLIGEIYDRITVTRATEAAEQGLVIATCENADAIAALVALRRFASDRFALAATLRLTIAQRLAARLCTACRRPEQAFGSTSALLGFDPGTILWVSDGCDACEGTGRRGSIGVFEAIEVDPAMRKLLYDGADPPMLARHAFLTAPNFASAARALARDGLIAAEDAVRVVRG
jgi:type II secretory ATPase GspE/PulE/Tfp pilus assembly ATPase PilB-like protein